MGGRHFAQLDELAARLARRQDPERVDVMIRQSLERGEREGDTTAPDKG